MSHFLWARGRLGKMIDQATLQAKFSEIRPLLNERQFRLVALAEAKFLGH
jgi:hypothetical protein